MVLMKQKIYTFIQISIHTSLSHYSLKSAKISLRKFLSFCVDISSPVQPLSTLEGLPVVVEGDLPCWGPSSFMWQLFLLSQDPNPPVLLHFSN